MNKIEWEEKIWDHWGPSYKGMKTYSVCVGRYELCVWGPSKIHHPSEKWLLGITKVNTGRFTEGIIYKRFSGPEEAKALAVETLKDYLLEEEKVLGELRKYLEKVGEL